MGERGETRRSDKLAVICPIGVTGNLVTMTINGLLAKKWKYEGQAEDRYIAGCSEETVRVQTYDEIIVIVPYTEVAKKPEEVDIKPIIQTDGEGELQREWQDGHFVDSGGLVYWAEGYRWRPRRARKAFSRSYENHRYGQELRGKIIANIKLLAFPIHPKYGENGHYRIDFSGVVPDIDDTDDNEQYQDLIYGLTRLLLHKDYDIHMSLAGGRKTMSAYQMTASSLLGPQAGVSHVLEPSKAKAKEVISLFGDVSLPNLVESAKKAYQPYTDLYEYVDVEYIDLSKTINIISRQFGFGDEVHEIIRNSSAILSEDIREVLGATEGREIMYRIGSIYRQQLEGRGIDDEIFKKFEQGIIGGFWLSFLDHDFGGRLLNVFRDAIDNGLPSYTDQGRDKINTVYRSLETLAKRAYKLLLDREVDWKIETCSLNDLVLTAAKIINREDRIGSLIEVKNDVTGIQTDKWLLSLLLGNLIKNAEEAYSGTGRDPNVEISAVEQNDRVTIRVKDFGCGICEEHRDKLFNVFTTKGGYHQGLGLHMVRRILRKMDGTIDLVESQAWKGTIFSVQIPEVFIRKEKGS